MTTPLAHPVFRRLFAAQIIALLGTGLATVALALLAYDLAGGKAGAVLGTALAIKMVAYVGVAPVMGALARHLPRRAMLVALDLARAVLIGCMPFVTEVWQIYLLIFALNACSAGFTPTFQATIPDVLPDDSDYTRALSLSRLAYDLENLLSPMLAAAALLVLSYDSLFVGNAVSFFCSALLVLSVQLPSPKPGASSGRSWQEMTFGIVAYLRTPRLRGLLALSMTAAAGGAMVIVNTVVYVRDHLGRDERDTALALAAYGAGSMIVALALPRLLEQRSDRGFMLAGSVVLSAGLLLGLSGPGFVGLLLIWLLLGVGNSLVLTPSGRLLKRSAAEADRPAIYAAQFALSHACWLLAYPIAGWVGSEIGMTVAFGVLAGIAIVTTVIAGRIWPRDDPAALPHVHKATVHRHEHVHDDHHRHDHEGSEGPEPHSHEHSHQPVSHTHDFVIDRHHPVWPARG